MCGRLTLQTPSDQLIQFLLPLVNQPNLPEDYVPRYNIAPTQSILGIKTDGENEKHLSAFRWGLIPGWASELGIGNRMINARRETLPEKRSFKEPLSKRRCLIVADGYFEWHRPADQKSKQAFWITPRTGRCMLLAGLWERNTRASDRPIESCTIITTEANHRMSQIHDRMPVPLVDAAAELWLDPECDSSEAYSLLRPVEDDFFESRPVTNYVNNPRNQGPECIAAVQKLF
jgi:putative SOS response-associated peptidase YedK